MEIIDGEMEMLHAGDWRNYLDGEHPYKVKANAATNLPPGGFFLMRTGAMLRLDEVTLGHPQIAVRTGWPLARGTDEIRSQRRAAES